MSDLLKNLGKLNKMQLALALLLATFILFPLPLPFELAVLIDTKLGSLVVVAFSIVLFLSVSPLIGILSFIAGYVLIYRAGLSTGSEMLRKYVPNEEQKHQDMMQLHDLEKGKTLEETAVEDIPTITTPYPPMNLSDGVIVGEGPYKPVYSESKVEHSEL